MRAKLLFSSFHFSQAYAKCTGQKFQNVENEENRFFFKIGPKLILYKTFLEKSYFSHLLLSLCSLVFTDSEKKCFFVFFAQNCHEKWVKQVSFSTSEFGSKNIIFEPKTCFCMWNHPKWFLNSSPKISLLLFESIFSLSEKIAVSSGQGLCQNKRC